MSRATIVTFLILSLSCHRRETKTADLEQMSAQAHDEAASAELEEAQAHLEAAEGYPNEGLPCRDIGLIYFPCWSQMANMSEYHLWEAKQHQRRAREHTAMAVMLRDAENRTCQSVPIEDKEISPFYHREDISSVLPVFSAQEGGAILGADVVFRPVKGMTQQNLQQIIDCQMARNAVLGYDQSWMPSCPLMLREISATVEESAEGVVVHLRAKDPAIAKELAARAKSAHLPEE